MASRKGTSATTKKPSSVTLPEGCHVFFDSTLRSKRGQWVLIINDEWPSGARRVRHIKLDPYLLPDNREGALASALASL